MAKEAALDAAPPPPGFDEFLQLPSYSEATSKPLRFEIWHGGGLGLKNTDMTVTTEDPGNVVFYLRCPTSWSGRLDLSLRRGNKDGEEIAKIAREASLSSLSFEVRMASAGAPILVRHLSAWDGKFQWNNGYEELVWLPGKKWRDCYNWSLSKASEANLPEEQRRIMARWLTPNWERRKSGTLIIQPDHSHEQDLIIATALGVGLGGSGQL
ncbi:hypothetical protein JCM6882_008579 [Rhodosporidiobolus microsporus]